ncbi:hypothetical protein CI610_02653 [invertebrate metagenome]|uniref:Integrase catalytic domain-containing protein n=1 Tax=invertebrate metagenome TaxID=1711999 RepID=A0A2H9T5C6_9ZZZZ
MSTSNRYDSPVSLKKSEKCIKSTRLNHHRKINDKKPETVENKIIQLMKQIPRAKIITLDNGEEFARHRAVSKASNTTIYFVQPYARYQRGIRENTKGIIRHYLSKKMVIEKSQSSKLMINTMPRKILADRLRLRSIQGSLLHLLLESSTA